MTLTKYKHKTETSEPETKDRSDVNRIVTKYEKIWILNLILKYF